VLLVSVLMIATAVFILTPKTVGAFWPISLLNASDNGLAQPVLHDESIDLLQAATHFDPNPTKLTLELEVSDGAALVANTGADGSLPTVENVTSSGRIAVYVVREGDALSEIADMYNVTVNTILWANDIKRASGIVPGQELIILPVTGVQYVVKKGDTLASIAKKYGADTADIIAYNEVDSDAALIAGNTIIIPGGEVAPAKTSIIQNIVKATTGGTAIPASSGLFSNPLPNGRVTQGIHGYNAVDLGAPYGSTIYAAASGKVIISRATGYNGGYGSYVVIDHGNGAQTLYAHMSSVVAGVGESIEKGEVVGYVGSTGRSTGNHLHFEVRGGYRNPFGK
jgi:LysM repeat protein